MTCGRRSAKSGPAPTGRGCRAIAAGGVTPRPGCDTRRRPSNDEAQALESLGSVVIAKATTIVVTSVSPAMASASSPRWQEQGHPAGQQPPALPVPLVPPTGGDLSPLRSRPPLLLADLLAAGTVAKPAGGASAVPADASWGSRQRPSSEAVAVARLEDRNASPFRTGRRPATRARGR